MYMDNKRRLPRIIATCAARITSVELYAVIPFSELQKQGLCEFRYKDEMFLQLADIAWCDILFIVRGASFYSVWAAQWAKKHERIVLGYWDDNFLCIPNYSLTYPYYSSPEVQSNISALFKLVDAFFSPNTKLAAKLTALHGNEVKVLPVIQGAEGLEPPKARDIQVPIVGYSGGPDHIRILNSLLGPVITEVAGTRANFKVHIVGPKPDFIGRVPVTTEYTRYISNYYDYLAFAANLGWAIGLAPQIDNEFTTYKTYIKFLEYTHIGCAGIYTKIEPYVGVIEDDINGLLVPNEVEAWSDAILRLLKDPELRFKILSNAYEFVQRHHNRKVVTEKYANALAPFLSHRAPGISKTYLLWSNQVYRFGGVYKGGTEYIRTYGIYGIRRFLRRAPRYLFSLLRQRLRGN
jgi:glycosyltransferase involved in cell wall biosynthesis